MMDKEGSTEIFNFMIPGVGIFVLGHGHIFHKAKMHSYAIADFYLFYDGAVDIQI